MAKRRPIPATLLALTACLAALPPARAIVIQVNSLANDGSIYWREISDGWRLVYPYSTSYFDYRKGSVILPTPSAGRFQVLSLVEPWNLTGTVQVDSVNLAALTIMGGSLQLGYGGASFGSLSMTGGNLSSDNGITVTGHAQIQGSIGAGYASFGSLTMTGGSFTGNAFIHGALSLRNTAVSANSVQAQSANINASTLSGLSLTVTDSLVLSDATVGQASDPAQALRADTMELINSTAHVGSLSVGKSLKMQRAQVQAGSITLDGATELVLVNSKLQAGGWSFNDSLTGLDLRASELSLPNAHIMLTAGSAGNLALGIDAGSKLLTASTTLKGDEAGTLQEAVFTQSAGSHTTGSLGVSERTAYVLAAPAGAAAGPTLTADTVGVSGALRMRGGTLTAGSLGVGDGGSFEQTAGQALFKSHWGIEGSATISGTAQLEAQLTSVGGRGLRILESAHVNAGQLSVYSSNVLLDRPGDAMEDPALRSTSAFIHSGFQHTRGHHVADQVELASGSSDTTSGWYWLDGGVLKTASLWAHGHFVQRGGEAYIGTISVAAVHAPQDANLLLTGGQLEADVLEAWGSQSTLIRQTGGAASFRALSLNGSRFELAIANPVAAVNDLTVSESLWIASTEATPGTFAHSAGRLLTRGYQVVDANGVYLLSGTAVLDGNQSVQPFEVLKGGRFEQQGEKTLVQVRGFSVDAGAHGLLRDGKAQFREWLAVSGKLRIDGKAQVDVQGSEFGLQVGVPYLQGEYESLTPGQAPGHLTLALTDTGLLQSSMAGVGTFESGVVQHDSGRHWITGTLTVGSKDVLADATYLLGSSGAEPPGARASLDADAIVLQNPHARTDTDRSRVRLEQVLGRSDLAFNNFNSLNSTHIVHAGVTTDGGGDGLDEWRIGERGRRLGNSYANYDSHGGALVVEGGLRLSGSSRMTVSPSPQLRGWADVAGSMVLTDRATLRLTDSPVLTDAPSRPTLLVRGGLAIESRPDSFESWAMEVNGAAVRVLGDRLAADRATVTAGSSSGEKTLLLTGPGARMQISGPQRTQLHIGASGAGGVSVTNQASLEIRAAPLGSTRPEISGDWRPLVVGNSGILGGRGPTLTVDANSRLLVEGRGNQLTVARGTASLAGLFNAVVVGKPGSPAIVGAPLSSSGLLQLHAGSRIEVTFDGYAPKAGDYIPLAAAQTIQYGAGLTQYLTPYESVKISAVDGYQFSLGPNNAVFRVAVPGAGLYPALERMKIGTTEVLGIRIVDQAVVLNLVDQVSGQYLPSGSGWEYRPSDRIVMAGSSLSRAALVQEYGSLLWGSPPEKNGLTGVPSLGSQLLLPYFVADSPFDSSRTLTNTVDVRFSDQAVAGLSGHTPKVYNSSNFFPVDVGNQQKDGRVNVFGAAALQQLDPARLASTVLHEVGHSLGLLHTYAAGSQNLMDYANTQTETFANVPLQWTEAPQQGGLGLLLTQNAKLHLLKYSFGWSDAELNAFGAADGSADTSWTSALNSLLLTVRVGLSVLGQPLRLDDLTVQTLSLTADGATLWEPLLTLDAAALADPANLQFAGIRGLPFRVVASLDGQDGSEIRFVGDAAGNTGNFGEGRFAGQLLQVDLATGAQWAVGSYALTAAAAVPEPGTTALFAAGGLLLWAGRRRAA